MYVCGLIPVSLFMGDSSLPFGDRLRGDAHGMGQLLLRDSSIPSQAADGFGNMQYHTNILSGKTLCSLGSVSLIASSIAQFY